MFFAEVNGLEPGLGSCVHVLMSGWTNVLPAPVRVGLDVRAAPAAATAIVARAATATRATEIRTSVPFLGIELPPRDESFWVTANVWERLPRVGNAAVAKWRRSGYRGWRDPPDFQ